MGTPHPESERDVGERIYRYVERRGAATREAVRDAVRVPDETGAKPARSGTEPVARLSVPEFDDHVEELLDDGALIERDGRLLLAADADAERHDDDGLEYVVRPADEDDRETIDRLVGTVAEEGALVVDERVADVVARESEGGLLRRTDRESRTVFVAETRPEDGPGETVGWVHVRCVELPARSHTAELALGVDPEYREEGVGTALLERGVSWADEAGCVKLYQHLPATNETAIEFLTARGWEREATRADHYEVSGGLVDEVQIVRRLDE